ncbi:MAG: hypothetical protein ACRER4_09165, partial [Steroidobacteraceae bacterium]
MEDSMGTAVSTGGMISMGTVVSMAGMISIGTAVCMGTSGFSSAPHCSGPNRIIRITAIHTPPRLR